MNQSAISKVIELVGLVAILVIAVFITSSTLETRQREHNIKVSLLVRQHADIIADQEQLNRRITQYNDAIEALYNLLDLLEDYESNKVAFQRAYNSHLKYAFLFTPRSTATRLITESYHDSDFEMRRLYDQLSRLYDSQQKAIDDQQGLMNFTRSDVWLSFFSKRIDLMTFDVVEDKPTFTSHFRNLLLFYIKEIEVTFLALQALDKEYTESLEVLALELEIQKIKLVTQNAEEDLDGQ